MTLEQAQEAARKIHARHRAAGDDALGNVGEDPADVLSYLRKHGHRMPDGIRVDDLFDAATLHLYLWWQAAERERWLLDTAMRLGIAHRDFGALFGMRSRQGIRDRSDRLHALLDPAGGGRPDEKVTRGDRADSAHDAVGEAAWLAAALPQVLQLARDVDEFYPVVDDETAEALIEVRRDLRDQRHGIDMFTMLAEAVEALATCPISTVARRTAPLMARLSELQMQRAAARGREVSPVYTAEIT